MRKGWWKLVAGHGGPWELYDLEADRMEQSDLAGRHTDKVAELAALYDRWAERCGVRPWDEVGRGTPTK